VAHVVEAVLERTDQVRVPGARARQAIARVHLALGAHQLPILLFELDVRDRDGDRRSHRQAVADAALDLERIRLEPLATASSVAMASASELTCDRIPQQRHARRHALEDDHEAGPVRFTGGQDAEHAAIIGKAFGLPLDGHADRGCLSVPANRTTSAASTDGSNGFVMMPAAPASRHRALTDGSLSAVSTITGGAPAEPSTWS